MTSSSRPPWDRYRLSAQRLERETEGHKLDSTSPFDSATPPEQAQSRLAKFWRSRGLTTAELAIIGITVVGMVAASIFLIRDTGFTSTGRFALVALFPLALVVWVLTHSDRISPLPTRYLLFAGLWGAGVATLIAGVVNGALFADFLAYLGNVEVSESLAATLVAPVSEELLKGIGVVLVLVLARKFVVSLSSGLTIGGLTGAGFAFTENIVYFAQAQGQGSSSLGMTIFARAVMSPFVHPLATSFIGIGVAGALLVPRGAWNRTWRVLLGWVAAMLVHAAWNGLASLGAAWIIWYLLLEVPIFVAWLVWVMKRPKKLLPRLAQGLGPYVATGWMSVDEEVMLTTLVGRKHAKKWARKVGKVARGAMRNYLVDAGRLGLEQVQIERSSVARERVLVAQESLSKMISNREIFLEQGRLAAAEGRVG